MSSNYSFVGEINRNNAMSAVADTMNELNLDILKATMEMGGKQVVEKDGNAYALERLDESEVKNLKDSATITLTTADFTIAGSVKTLTKGGDDNYYGADGLVVGENEAGNWVASTGDAVTNKTGDVTTTTYSQDIKNRDTAAAIFDILGINPGSDIDGKLDGNNWKINLSTDGSNVTMKVAYVDANTGNNMGMAVVLDSDGVCKGLSELKQYDSLNGAVVADEKIIAVDGGGLLESWGIRNPEELQPGDLFLVQQKLQIIKDTVSAVHTTGKTQGDIMREATQKFAQG